MIRHAAVYMLNKLVMEPAGWKSFTVGHDLDDEGWMAEVPVGPGVYLLYTPGHFFTLPGGGTSVLYIGKGTAVKASAAGYGNTASAPERSVTAFTAAGTPATSG